MVCGNYCKASVLGSSLLGVNLIVILQRKTTFVAIVTLGRERGLEVTGRVVRGELSIRMGLQLDGNCH